MPADKCEQSTLKSVLIGKEELDAALYVIQKNNYNHSLDKLDELLSDLLAQMDMAGSTEAELEAKGI